MVKNVLQIRIEITQLQKKKSYFHKKYIDVIIKHHHKMCDLTLHLKMFILSAMHNDNSFCVFAINIIKSKKFTILKMS